MACSNVTSITPHCDRSDHGPKVNVYFSVPTFSVPSIDDIIKKWEDGGKIMEWAGVKVARILPSVIVKFGPHVTVTEAKSMIYVAQHSNKIPIPQVYAYYTYGPISRDIDDYGSLFDTYIFMSFVDGQTLDVAWESYDESTKLRISFQLKECVDDLRRIGKASYIGSVDYGPVTDQILGNYEFQGPFDSEEEFNNTIIEAYLSKAPKEHVKNFLVGMISQHKHRISFTHGDFRPQNILVKDGKLTGIIDWELSGWYPEYWEFAKALYVWQWQNDWGDYLMKILQPYYPEYAFHSFVSKILW